VQDGEDPGKRDAADTNGQEGEDRSFWGWLLGIADRAVYAAVGIFFVLAALFSLLYGVYAFLFGVLHAIGSDPVHWLDNLVASNNGGQAIINLVSDLLLTLIIMEVLDTIAQHLRNRRATTLKPFLIIGIISATRGVLAIGARLSVSGAKGLTADDFTRSMVELGVNAAVIIALGATMRIVGDLDSGGTSGRKRGGKPETLPPGQGTSASDATRAAQ
jgi:hypothetical protein